MSETQSLTISNHRLQLTVSVTFPDPATREALESFRRIVAQIDTAVATMVELDAD